MEIDPCSNESTFSASFPEKYENKLQDAWPQIEAALEYYGIACALNLAERCVTISKTARTKGRNYYNKATRLVELLTTTHVPPHTAIEILHVHRIHILIKIGNQDGGLCSKFQINKAEFIKRWQRLACSLEAIATATTCNIFLNENNIAAVGSAVPTVRVAVVDCIANNKNPETCLKRLSRMLLHKYGPIELQQSDVSDIGSDKCGPSLEFGNELTTYCSFIKRGREKEVLEAWPFVHWFLKGHNISSTLNSADRCLIISTTRRTMYPDIVDHAGHFLELLTETGIPATKAAEVLNGRLHYEVIRTYFWGGGLCTKFEIEKDHHKNMERLKRNSKELARLLKCDIYTDKTSAVAVGTSASGLRLFRSIVECCFLKNEDPVAVARRLKLDHKLCRLMKKLQALCL